LNCSEGYYQKDSSQICIPDCYTWNLYDKSLSLTITVIVILMAVVGSTAAVSILIISFLKPTKM